MPCLVPFWLAGIAARAFWWSSSRQRITMALPLNPPSSSKGVNMAAAIRQFALATTLVMCCTAMYCTAARGADTYTVDPVHSSISFMISHVGISNIHGRFNAFSGKITIDQADPAKSSFALSIPIASIDTNNVKRDEHLRAPDYFNAKQFPTMSFQSTNVKAVDGGYEVTGDLTLHGVTKPVSFTLKGGDKVVEFPKKIKRIGFVSTFSIRRSDFGVNAELKLLGDEISITVGIEAAK
jgi:polyisoprenoid-binding protein YceI